MNPHWLRAAMAAMTAIGAIAVQTRSGSGAAVGGEDDVHAPALLSEAGLYLPGQVRVVDERNRRFSPQYPLWSDGAV